MRVKVSSSSPFFFSMPQQHSEQKLNCQARYEQEEPQGPQLIPEPLPTNQHIYLCRQMHFSTLCPAPSAVVFPPSLATCLSKLQGRPSQLKTNTEQAHSLPWGLSLPCSVGRFLGFVFSFAFNLMFPTYQHSQTKPSLSTLSIQARCLSVPTGSL